MKPNVCKKYFGLSYLSAFVLTSMLPLYAEEQLASLTTEDDFLSGIPIVLTATRLSQNALQAPSSITVIDSAMIKASGASEVSDLFRLAPGFQVAYFANNTAVVASNGLTGDWQRRLQVLVDGRSVYIPLLSTVDWATIGIDLEDIERIEIVRGSNTPAFGSNAFLGVINIITKQAFGAPRLAVDTSIGSSRAPLIKNLASDFSIENTKTTLDARKVGLRHGGSAFGVDYRISAGFREDTGFRDANDGKKITDASFRATYNPSLNDILDMQAGVSSGTLGAFNNSADATFDKVRDKKLLSHFQSVKWTRANGSNNEWKFHAYHNYFKEDDIQNIGLASDVISKETNSTFTPLMVLATYGHTDGDLILGTYDGIGERYDAEVQYTGEITALNALPNWRVVGGVGGRIDLLQSQSLLARSDVIDEKTARVFGNIEIPVVESLLTFNLGAMLELNPDLGRYFSPRAAANFNLNKNNMVRVSATSAYRMPSLLEQNFKQGVQFANDHTVARVFHLSRSLATSPYSSAKLKPEKIFDYEIGYIFDSSENRVTFDARMFVEEIHDGILQVTDGSYPGQPYSFDTYQAFIWDNVIESKVVGTEIQIRFRPITHSLASLQYAYAKCQVCRYERRRNPEEIRDISSSVPANTISALLAYRTQNKVDLSMNYYYVDAISWLEDGNDIPAYHRLDARVGKAFKFERYNANVALVGQSITGQYNEFRLQYWFEPRAYMQFSISM